MSSLSCDVVKLDIEPHPDADALDLARIGDYRAVVAKGMFKSGDMAVYIPEASVLPGPVIEKLGLVGRLAGSNKNRVKAIKLRGVLSQGLVYPIKNNTLELPDGNTISSSLTTGGFFLENGPQISGRITFIPPKKPCPGALTFS